MRKIYLFFALFLGIGTITNGQSCFELTNTFTITTPSSFDSTWLDRFYEKFKNNIAIIDRIDSVLIKSKTFRIAVDPLEPGVRYIVEIYLCEERGITIEKCLEFMKERGAILVGAPGLSLLIENDIQTIPEKRWFLCPGNNPDEVATPMVMGGEGYRWIFRRARTSSLPAPAGLVVFKKA